MQIFIPYQPGCSFLYTQLIIMHINPVLETLIVWKHYFNSYQDVARHLAN